MENIGTFLSGCEDYGLKKADLFQTVDLYEAQNIPQVIATIHALGRRVSREGNLPLLHSAPCPLAITDNWAFHHHLSKPPVQTTCLDHLSRPPVCPSLQAQRVGFNGPALGPKEATGAKRDFSESQLREGQNVIGLQMGSNKGATQSGQTPYGLGRQIAPGHK